MSVAWLSRFAILLACLGLSGCFPPQEAKLDENKNPYLLEGKARVAARDYKGAIEAFEKALEVHPRSALAHFEVAMLYEQHSEQTEKDYINAMYHYQQVLKLRPPGVYPHDNAKVRIASCKQELVKSESLAPVYYAMERELLKLREDNQLLRKQVETLQGQVSANRNQTPAAQSSDTPVSSSGTLLTARADTGSPRTTTTTTTRRAVEEHAITPLPGSAAGIRIHTVREGDTPASIARL